MHNGVGSLAVAALRQRGSPYLCHHALKLSHVDCASPGQRAHGNLLRVRESAIVSAIARSSSWRSSAHASGRCAWQHVFLFSASNFLFRIGIHFCSRVKRHAFCILIFLNGIHFSHSDFPIEISHPQARRTARNERYIVTVCEWRL